MKTIILPLLLAGVLLDGFCLHAQDMVAADPLDVAREYIGAHLNAWGLSPQDTVGMTVNDRYTDKTSGIARIYFLQRHRDIPVYNAILNLSIDKTGKVFFAGNRFVPDLAGKVNTGQPVLSAGQAVAKLAAHLGLPTEELRLKDQTGETHFVFEKGSIAKEDITATLSYQPCEGKALLSWDILFSPAGKADKWSTRVDAVTGAVLNEFNWTVYCFQNIHPFEGENGDFHARPPSGPDQDFEHLANLPETNTTATGAQYNVWPAPIESPNHGPRTLVTDPADPLASPFGWHDQNGQPGAENTVTWGNNAIAYQDRDGDNISSLDEPDGGVNLHFDFPYAASWEPEQHTDASVVNLFYWTNYMHDFAYHFGFDEQAGNFQHNNYGKGGAGNDPMFALAQTGADANFFDFPYYTHSDEGASPAIRLSEYKTISKFLTVNEPAAVAGIYYTSVAGPGWGTGAYITSVPVSGEVVVVNDGVEEPSATDACEDIANAPELAGKIALIDRGTCEFGFKALQAQNAGAIGVIVCDYIDEYYWKIYHGNYGAEVHIPIVIISYLDGQQLRQFAGNGLKVSLVDPGIAAPEALDFSLDNGLIAHEYAHGISWRLAGGPDAACFNNYEQMDEGWSDFIALATTVKPGDTGSKKRGIGTYILDMPTTGRGARRYPYSTDMSISPLTYGDVARSHIRHHVGEIWCNVMWDMYWALVDQYGWSANNYDASSGNYKAIRLVFEGLKNLPCSPGFVDGRNAILAADEALYNGENQCLLWEVFARRGLGYSADQGSPFDAGDQKEAFDVHPLCSDKIRIKKSVTDFIQPGDNIEVSIKVGNFKTQPATGVVVTDEIPAGLTFKANSSSWPAQVQGNTVSFNLGNMNFAQETAITYTLESSPDAWSVRKFLDDVPDANNALWLVKTVGGNTTNPWSVTDDYPAHSGAFSWHVKEASEQSQQILEMNPASFTFHVDGSRPALRFYHRYRCEGGISGGMVEVRELGTTSWEQVGDKMLRNAYPDVLYYFTFNTHNVQAFSGNSGNAFQASYVDLSKWAGKDIQVRFRFGNLDGAAGDLGWLIDDIEFMDMLAYNGEVCVTTNQGDLECAIAPESGTIVDSRAEPLDAGEQSKEFAVKIYPNPAADRINIALPDEGDQKVNISLLTTDGRSLLERSFDGRGNNLFYIDTANVPAGLYLVKISSTKGQYVGKAVIQK